MLSTQAVCGQLDMFRVFQATSLFLTKRARTLCAQLDQLMLLRDGRYRCGSGRGVKQEACDGPHAYRGRSCPVRVPVCTLHVVLPRDSSLACRVHLALC